MARRIKWRDKQVPLRAHTHSSSSSLRKDLSLMSLLGRCEAWSTRVAPQTFLPIDPKSANISRATKPHVSGSPGYAPAPTYRAYGTASKRTSANSHPAPPPSLPVCARHPVRFAPSHTGLGRPFRPGIPSKQMVRPITFSCYRSVTKTRIPAGQRIAPRNPPRPAPSHPRPGRPAMSGSQRHATHANPCGTTGMRGQFSLFAPPAQHERAGQAQRRTGPPHTRSASPGSGGTGRVRRTTGETRAGSADDRQLEVRTPGTPRAIGATGQCANRWT